MVGGPSQMDIYDYKPQMNDWYDKDLPESIRNAVTQEIEAAKLCDPEEVWARVAYLKAS
jgi:hypothetical protein